jgi:hypothetical protein
MKIIASILILYFGLLMMQPFYNIDVVMAKPIKTCTGGMCSKMKSQHNQKSPCSNSTTCNTDFCNPFVPCGISIAYRSLQIHFVNPVLELSKNKKPTINDDITSDYLADCWRPPELLS